MLVQLAEVHAGHAVDVLVHARLQRHAGVLGDHPREESTVGAHQRRQEGRVRLDAEVREGGQPRLDARPDGVHEGAVKVEDEGAGGRKSRGSLVHGHAHSLARGGRSSAPSRTPAAPPGRAASVTGRWQAKPRQT